MIKLFKNKFEILGFLPVDGLKEGSGIGLWHFMRTRKSVVKFCLSPLGKELFFQYLFFKLFF